MKLLVLAQTPPPIHGQSVMVQALVQGLPAHGIALEHVNLSLSRDTSDIGRWRPGKFFRVFVASVRTVFHRYASRCDTLYYVPAPGKRGALYRDWVAMALCRPFFPRLVLHWHAVGLGEWLEQHATFLERSISHWLLGRADLSISLTPSLQTDAAKLTPKKNAVIANGIADPGTPTLAYPRNRAQFRILFLGAITEEKGAGVLLAAVQLLRARQVPAVAVYVGEAREPALKQKLVAAAAADPGSVDMPGFTTGAQKQALLETCDCVCLPTHYRNEAQPLVILEALAADRPVVVTDWRGLAETVPPGTPLVPPQDPAQLAAALLSVKNQPPPAGAQRSFFLSHYTVEHHLAALARALRG